MMRSLLLVAAALACSSAPEVSAPPACEPDGYLIARAPCVVSCVADSERWRFGSCEEPEGQTDCVTFTMGQIVSVVRLNGAESAGEDDFVDEVCQ